jgi:hypothetical protein
VPAERAICPALADLQLDVVHDRADRDVADRHGVAGLHVDLTRRPRPVADGQALRRQDVGELAVAYLISAMNAVRFGSYSIRSTGGGHAQLRGA